MSLVQVRRFVLLASLPMLSPISRPVAACGVYVRDKIAQGIANYLPVHLKLIVVWQRT